MNRRSFLKQTGLAAGATAVHNLQGATQGVALIVDPNDPVASSAAPVGRQAKTRRRLGVSPGPEGLNGPVRLT